jgi:hypothetical protein
LKGFIIFTFLQVPEDAKEIKVGSLIALMVAEGEDWKSVEVPAAGDTVPASNVKEETKESEQPTGGNSNDIYIYKFQLFY